MNKIDKKMNFLGETVTLMQNERDNINKIKNVIGLINAYIKDFRELELKSPELYMNEIIDTHNYLKQATREIIYNANQLDPYFLKESIKNFIDFKKELSEIIKNKNRD